ncbi:metal-sulfur cluster assembly factor [Gleimia sp. 6138-11-ORH1]|uniref:metal-sulfur cluster assembly factor n=1 Tax=Gleimia sp. 6138-11-ORH1 TaxID=2973937 RepID=UPI00216858C8|nr:metal-sulfur cluster assembly factor [Gleimia sp. 6138-11-ORH1]MCS4484554.1 metal-sulfur cluster assembly factor [Gleimia sp. 6138-11-ORH1]
MDNPMANQEPVEQRFAEVEAERLEGVSLSSAGDFDAAQVEELLKDVIDPELGINIVDLGLVYGIAIDENNRINIDMTLTSAACPLTDVIENQAQTILSELSSDVVINWVWLPPWGPDRITEDGREQLRALGFNI